jgi:endonuclease YncB( thermonuclease family)
MDLTSISQQLTFELNSRLQSKNLPLVRESSITEILKTLEELNYTILPKGLEADSSQIHSFDRIVAQWSYKIDTEPEDVNGQQILQSLASEGWIIIPPQ